MLMFFVCARTHTYGCTYACVNVACENNSTALVVLRQALSTAPYDGVSCYTQAC